MKKIRLTRVSVVEYIPDPTCFPEGTTIEEMAAIDAQADDRELLFDELVSDEVTYEIVEDTSIEEEAYAGLMESALTETLIN